MAFRRREEELLAEKEACSQRVQQLEEAMSNGGRREEDLRQAVRAARLADAPFGTLSRFFFTKFYTNIEIKSWNGYVWLPFISSTF